MGGSFRFPLRIAFVASILLLLVRVHSLPSEETSGDAEATVAEALIMQSANGGADTVVETPIEPAIPAEEPAEPLTVVVATQMLVVIVTEIYADAITGYSMFGDMTSFRSIFVLSLAEMLGNWMWTYLYYLYWPCAVVAMLTGAALVLYHHRPPETTQETLNRSQVELMFQARQIKWHEAAMQLTVEYVGTHVPDTWEVYLSLVVFFSWGVHELLTFFRCVLLVELGIAMTTFLVIMLAMLHVSDDHFDVLNVWLRWRMRHSAALCGVLLSFFIHYVFSQEVGYLPSYAFAAWSAYVLITLHLRRGRLEEQLIDGSEEKSVETLDSVEDSLAAQLTNAGPGPATPTALIAEMNNNNNDSGIAAGRDDEKLGPHTFSDLKRHLLGQLTDVELRAPGIPAVLWFYLASVITFVGCLVMAWSLAKIFVILTLGYLMVRDATTDGPPLRRFVRRTLRASRPVLLAIDHGLQVAFGPMISATFSKVRIEMGVDNNKILVWEISAALYVLARLLGASWLLLVITGLSVVESFVWMLNTRPSPIVQPANPPYGAGVLSLIGLEAATLGSIGGIGNGVVSYYRWTRLAHLLVAGILGGSALLVISFIAPPFGLKKAMLRAWSKSNSTRGENFVLRVSRERLFEESLQQLTAADDITLSQRLTVTFVSEGVAEEGQDAGGLTKEWIHLFMQAAVDPQRQMFTRPDVSCPYNLNYKCVYLPEYEESWFRGVGRCVGKAIRDGHVSGIQLTPSVYKCLFDAPISFDDLKTYDSELYRQKLRFCPETGGVDLDFSIDLQDPHVTVPLLPNGEDIPVTRKNYSLYLDLYARFYLSYQIADQLAAFRAGFLDVISPLAISRFSPAELAQLVEGEREVHMADWQANTEYTGGYTNVSPTIVLFWEYVATLSNQKRLALIQAVTSSPGPPLGGFGTLGPRFTVQRWDVGDEHYPKAATCFNKLTLPPYSSLAVLTARLNMLVDHNTGFGRT